MGSFRETSLGEVVIWACFVFYVIMVLGLAQHLVFALHLLLPSLIHHYYPKLASMSSLISDIQRSLQYAVSGDKYRFREGQWDLDLTYITSRIIAMGIPGEGVSSSWRNNIKDVASFFHAKHAGHFRIFNLSGDTYNYHAFDNRVAEYSFPDHHPPPLDVFLACLKDMHQWLSSDPENILAVHCLAGRSRTGTIVSGYLLYSSFCENALRAISYFNSKRSLEAKDICLPSQIRYVGYLDSLLQDHERTALRHPETRILRAVIISPPFRLEGSVKSGTATWKPNVRLINQSLPQETIFKKTYPTVIMNLPSIRLELPSVALKGDAMLKLSHVASNPITYGRACMKIQKVAETATSLDSDLIVDIARISFHTSFIEGNTATFESFEIDAHKAGPINADGKYIPSNLRITLEFEPKGTSPTSTSTSTSTSSTTSSTSSPVNSYRSTGSSSAANSYLGGGRSRSNTTTTASSPRTPIHTKDIDDSPKLRPVTVADVSPMKPGYTRPRNKSDPASTDFLAPTSNPKGGTSVRYHYASSSVSSSSSSSSTHYYAPGYTLQPAPPASNTVVDGHAHGFSGIGVQEHQLDAIAEFKAEQAARKQAAMAAHVASSPVHNKYLPTGNTNPTILVHPVPTPILHPHINQVPSATGPIPMSSASSSPGTTPNGYPPGYVHPQSATGIPTSGYPPGYTPPVAAAPRKRPVSVHFGAVPASTGPFLSSPSSGIPGASTSFGATPPKEPVYAPSNGYNPYQNPYAPTSDPYHQNSTDSNPYKPGRPYAAVPDGWPPGHPNAAPTTSPNPYAPVSSGSGYSTSASANPYAPRTTPVMQWRW